MSLEIYNKTKIRFDKSRVKKVASFILKKYKLKQDVTLVFVGLAEIKKLNNSYRGKNKVTDALSFVYNDAEDLGEIVVCLPKLKQDANDFDLKLISLLDTVMVHAFMHLIGFDHKTKNQSQLMEKQERKIHQALKKLN